MIRFWESLLAVLMSLLGSASGAEPAQRESAVGLVGDSVTWEHLTAIEQELRSCGIPPVVVDAVPGRVTTTIETPFGPIPSGVEAVERIEQEVDPRTWIIEMGVNDVNAGRVTTEAGAMHVIDSVLRLLDPTDDVFWVDTYTEVGRPADSALFNDVLRADQRITVIGWAEHAAPFVYDGLHPTEDGARLMAELYCSALDAVER